MWRGGRTYGTQNRKGGKLGVGPGKNSEKDQKKRWKGELPGGKLAEEFAWEQRKKRKEKGKKPKGMISEGRLKRAADRKIGLCRSNRVGCVSPKKNAMFFGGGRRNRGNKLYSTKTEKVAGKKGQKSRQTYVDIRTLAELGGGTGGKETGVLRGIWPGMGMAVPKDSAKGAKGPIYSWIANEGVRGLKAVLRKSSLGSKMFFKDGIIRFGVDELLEQKLGKDRLNVPGTIEGGTYVVLTTVPESAGRTHGCAKKGFGGAGFGHVGNRSGQSHQNTD